MIFILLLPCVAMMVLTVAGCKEAKTASHDVQDADSSDVGLLCRDTLDTLLDDAPTPSAADELFDDFFFAFAGSAKFQAKRIQFPLPVTDGMQRKEIAATAWKQEHFYMRDEFYTQIFDNDRQMELAKDTALAHVVVEKIDLPKHHVRHYVFDRKQGRWMLTAMAEQPLEQNPNASFLAFYERISTDPDFLQKSINDPLDYSGPNPDDDFENITGIILPEQWSLFGPQLPTGTIYNILYGQKYGTGGQKLFYIRGIANGYEAVLTFKKQGNSWKLTKLNM